MKLLIINGANINLLGSREKEHYGSFSYQDLMDYFGELAKIHGIEIDSYQSNIEGEIVDKIQSIDGYDALIINPAGYSHTSVVILDALLTLDIPIIEVHLSNIHAREEFRNQSITARAADGIISGFGKESYSMAVEYLIKHKNK